MTCTENAIKRNNIDIFDTDKRTVVITLKLPRPYKTIKYTSNKGGMDIETSIRIPNVMWTAGCCIGSDPQKVESIAVIGNNRHPDTFTRSTTVLELQLMLADYNSQKPVILFPGQKACSDPGNSYDLNFYVES